jgi:hypothetical protein
MQCTGHKSSKAFYSYIKVTPEEHAKDIKQLWDKAEKNLKAA